MVIWYSQEHRMFFENWKVHWLRESETCWVWTLSAWWYSDLWWNLFLLFPGFRCSKYRSFCWLTLREWILCKWQEKNPSKFKKLRHFCWRLCIKILLVFWTVKCETIERCSTGVTVFKEAQFRLNYGFGANSFTILSLFYENFEVHDFPLINSHFLVWL